MSTTDTRAERAAKALHDDPNFNGDLAAARTAARAVLSAANHTGLALLEQAVDAVDLAASFQIVSGTAGIRITHPELPDALERLLAESGQPSDE